MKSFQSFIAILAVFIMINTSALAAAPSTELAERKLLQVDRLRRHNEDKRERILLFGLHPKPKPKPDDGSSGGSSSGSSGGSSGSGGSGGGGSGGGSGGGGGGGGGANGALSSDFLNSKAKKSLAVMLSIAAVAGMAIAAVAIPRRKIATEKSHPLHGALNKRIGLFSNMAKHASERPPRRDEEGRYINADSIA